jgi:hypothetical protein
VTRSSGRLAVCLVALALAVEVVLGAGRPAAADPEPISHCTAGAGVIVAVDFGHWAGPLLRSCGSSPSSGFDLINQGGWRTSGTQHDGPGFICRIGYAGYRHGTEYPTPAEQSCVVTPPANAYWAFWQAGPGQDTWSYSQAGATSVRPAPGSVELWSFGATNLTGTTGSAVPVISPRQLRAMASPPGGRSAGTPRVINAPPVRQAQPARSSGSGYPTLIALAIAMLLAVAVVGASRRRKRSQR